MLDRCLSFQQLVTFIADREDQEFEDYESHIHACDRCAGEVAFLTRLMQAAGTGPEGEAEPVAGDHISEEEQDRYFQRTLSADEIDRVHNHVIRCEACFAAFDAVCSAAIAATSQEEHDILARIDAVQVTDRLQPFRARFSVPDRQTVAVKPTRRLGWLAMPAWGYSFALILVSIVGYFGYQTYETRQVTRQAGEVFSGVLTDVFIPLDQLRPSGEFKPDLVGQTKAPEEEGSLEIRALEEMVAAHPDNAKLNHFLATALFFSNDIDSAEKYYKKALELDPGNAKIHNDLGLVAMSRELTAEALQHIRKALEINPDLLEAQYNLAALLGLTGQKPEAVAAWQRYLELDPDESSGWHRVARSELSKLQ